MELWEEIKEKLIQLRQIVSYNPAHSMPSQNKIKKFLDLQSSCNEEREKGLVIDDDKSEPDANPTFPRSSTTQEQTNKGKNTASTKNSNLQPKHSTIIKFNVKCQSVYRPMLGKLEKQKKMAVQEEVT